MMPKPLTGKPRPKQAPSLDAVATDGIRGSDF